jgi:acyl carrier protein
MDDATKAAIIGLSAQAGKVEPESVTPDMNLRTGLGLDSLTLVNLLMRCGEEFGIDPDDLIEKVAVEKIQTVADVVGMGGTT